MRLNKILAMFVALTLALELLPLSLFADDTEELTYTLTEQSCSDSSSDLTNDELLEGYIEELFGISDDGIMLTATYSGEDALSGVNLYVYNELKTAVANIASGATSSTVVTVSLTDYGYTADTLNDAYAAFSSACTPSLVVDYILNDCPYEMYWFSKTYGTSVSASKITTTYGDGSTTESYIITSLNFTFYVATDYQASGSETTVDTSKVTAAQTAVANAKAIVEKYADAGYSDLELLTAYKEEICGLVSYEYDNEVDYGDIWQLVYVFDGDTSTNVVCEGYSKAFQYLCDQSGLYSIIVSGKMNGGDHMWNIVWLSGVNYLVDVTNSDSGSVGQDGGLFMVCADDATAISESGYTFTANNQAITYTYDTSTLAMYEGIYDEYLALGTKYYGRSLTLDGEIGVTYYFNLDGVTNPENYVLKVSIDGTAVDDVKASETKKVNDIEYYRYIVYVSPTQLDSDISVTLTDGTNTVAVDTYSVYDYCEYAITDTSGEWDAEKPLCEALLNYGYYVEILKNGSSSIDIKKDLDSSWTDPVTGTWDADFISIDTSDGVTGKTLALDGTGIYIRLYVSDNAGFTVSGKEVITGTDGTYGNYIEFKIPAKEMSNVFTIYKDGEVWEVVTTSNTETKIQAAAKADEALAAYEYDIYS
ncbi:MAG: hypothetical protein LUG49_06455 [Oscillospiraceae bacterium]|nr:hypothetical protein [Oscillospiraceae bacterium]